MLIRRSKRVHHIDFLLQLIDFQQLVVRVSKYSKSLSQNSDTPANAVNIFQMHKIFSDINRVRIKIECGLNSFFLPKIADYNRVRVIFELIGYFPAPLDLEQTHVFFTLSKIHCIEF